MLIIDNRYKIDNEKDEDLQIDKLYRAKDLQLDSDVYIKVIRDNTTIKDTFIANLVDESMMMSNIDCDNVANILDVITDESKYYIVSEYFNGISLFDLVNKNNIKNPTNYLKKIFFLKFDKNSKKFLFFLRILKKSGGFFIFLYNFNNKI